MIDQLRRNVINLKSLDQDITDPIIAGAGESGGPQLYVILTQEAAARFTDTTKLYLSWKHLDLDIRGYDMFEKISDKPITWALKWPRNMKHEGTVEACLEIVDRVSIDQSTHFHIEVLSDMETDQLLDEDEYDLFHRLLLEIEEKMREADERIDRAETLLRKLLDLYSIMQRDYRKLQEQFKSVQTRMDVLEAEWERFRDFHFITEKDIDRLFGKYYDERVGTFFKNLQEQGLLKLFHGIPISKL